MCGRETSASQHSLQSQASCVWHAVGSPLLPVCSHRVKLTIMDDTHSHGDKTKPGFTIVEVLTSVSLNYRTLECLSQDMMYQTSKTNNRR